MSIKNTAAAALLSLTLLPSFTPPTLGQENHEKASEPFAFLFDRGQIAKLDQKGKKMYCSILKTVWDRQKTENSIPQEERKKLLTNVASMSREVKCDTFSQTIK